MSKTSYAALSLIAAIPAMFLCYLLTMAFLSHADKMHVVLSVVAGLTLLTSAAIAVTPVGIMLGGGKRTPKPPKKSKKAAKAEMAAAAAATAESAEDLEMDETLSTDDELMDSADLDDELSDEWDAGESEEFDADVSDEWDASDDDAFSDEVSCD